MRLKKITLLLGLCSRLFIPPGGFYTGRGLLSEHQGARWIRFLSPEEYSGKSSGIFEKKMIHFIPVAWGDGYAEFPDSTQGDGDGEIQAAAG